MNDLLFFFAFGLSYFGLGTLLLHELGHWLVLKAWKIPYHIYRSKWGLIGFEAESVDSYDAIQVCLFGAVTPLLILVYPMYVQDFGLIYCGLGVSLFQALWSIFEAWRCVNVGRAKEKAMENGKTRKN